jgi:hypothetical protein
MTKFDCGKIHISRETALLLTEAGKDHWFTPREDTVHAKGKGFLATFWLEISPRCGRNSTDRSSADASSCGISDGGKEFVCDVDIDEKTRTHINWKADILAKLLLSIDAKRCPPQCANMSNPVENKEFHLSTQTVLDEVQEIIHLPDFEGDQSGDSSQAQELSTEVIDQLQSFVTSSK